MLEALFLPSVRTKAGLFDQTVHQISDFRAAFFFSLAVRIPMGHREAGFQTIFLDSPIPDKSGKQSKIVPGVVALPPEIPDWSLRYILSRAGNLPQSVGEKGGKS